MEILMNDLIPVPNQQQHRPQLRATLLPLFQEDISCFSLFGVAEEQYLLYLATWKHELPGAIEEPLHLLLFDQTRWQQVTEKLVLALRRRN